MLETKQLYEGAEKTPFYPKVPLQALDGIAQNTTLEDNVKTIWKTVYGTETPGKTSSTSSIDTVPEVYNFLSGYDNLQKLSDLIGGGSGSNVSISNTYNDGKRIATVKINGNPTDINVPSSVVSDFMASSNLWKLVYDPDTTLLELKFNNTTIASEYLSNEEVPAQYLKPSAPTGVNATYSSSTGNITVTWNPVWENHTPGIEDAYVPTYEVQRYFNGQILGDRAIVNTTEWVDTNASTEGMYEYTVYARSTASTYLSDESAKTAPITVLNGSSEDDVPRQVTISFENHEVSHGTYAGGNYINILRNMNDSSETYTGKVSVFGSSAFLDTTNSVRITDFDGNERVVPLGNKVVSGPGYCKEGTVTITRVNQMIAPSSVCVIQLHALSSSDGKDLLYGTQTFNFVYPMYAGYVDETAWDNAVNNDDVEANNTVMVNGIPVTDPDQIPGGLANGYDLNGYLFNCNFTQSQKSNSQLDYAYTQVAIPYDQTYIGFGSYTSDANMPTKFLTTDVIADMYMMSKDFKRVVPFNGVNYWVYTSGQAVRKSRTPDDGITIKSVV